jgi:uncharacterized protein YecT (DUF1311 family)
MKHLATLLFFWIVVFAMPASARDQTMDVSGVMDACLSEATGVEDTMSAQRQCIGKASAMCMKSNEARTTIGMTSCYAQELEWWDERLNREYKELKRTLEKDEFAAIRDIQRKWIAFKDASCSYIGDHQFKGGSLARPVTVNCVMDVTAVRSIELSILLNHYTGQ